MLTTSHLLIPKMATLTKNEKELLTRLALTFGARYEVVISEELALDAIYDAKEMAEEMLGQKISEETLQAVIADIPSQIDNYEVVDDRLADDCFVQSSIELQLKK